MLARCRVEAGYPIPVRGASDRPVLETLVEPDTVALPASALHHRVTDDLAVAHVLHRVPPEAGPLEYRARPGLVQNSVAA